MSRPYNDSKITKWYLTGDFSDPLPETIDDLMILVGNALDESCVEEILGGIAFRADDGKIYRPEIICDLFELSEEELVDMVMDYSDQSEIGLDR